VSRSTAFGDGGVMVTKWSPAGWSIRGADGEKAKPRLARPLWLFWGMWGNEW